VATHLFPVPFSPYVEHQFRFPKLLSYLRNIACIGNLSKPAKSDGVVCHGSFFVPSNLDSFEAHQV
jgi:hypothetical protein